MTACGFQEIQSAYGIRFEMFKRDRSCQLVGRLGSTMNDATGSQLPHKIKYPLRSRISSSW